MPSPRRISETLFRASLFLLVIVIPFTTMAIPVITQEFARAPTPTSVASVKLTHKEIFDIVFALVLFLFVIGTFAWVGGFPFPPFAAVDWLHATSRPVLEALYAFRFRARFQRIADAIVGTVNARAAPLPQVPEGDTNPAPTALHRLPAQNAEPEGFSDTRRCASSASDDSHLTSPSTA